MQFFVTKTGLDAFDTARAWGLAVLLNVLTQDEVRLQDASWAFILEPRVYPPKCSTNWVSKLGSPFRRWRCAMGQCFRDSKGSSRGKEEASASDPGDPIALFALRFTTT